MQTQQKKYEELLDRNSADFRKLIDERDKRIQVLEASLLDSSSKANDGSLKKSTLEKQVSSLETNLKNSYATINTLEKRIEELTNEMKSVRNENQKKVDIKEQQHLDQISQLQK